MLNLKEVWGGWEKQGVLCGEAGVDSWASRSISSARTGVFLVMLCAHHVPSPVCSATGGG